MPRAQPATTPQVEATPAAGQATTATDATPETPGLTSAPDAWQLLDLEADGVPGVSATRTYAELLAGRTPSRNVVVAVIDGGIDTTHVDLRENLWINEDETAGDGVDDDQNGYVDDIYGWNFLGGSDGRSVGHETLEVTRLHAACLAGEPRAGIDTSQLFHQHAVLVPVQLRAAVLLRPGGYRPAPLGHPLEP